MAVAGKWWLARITPVVAVGLLGIILAVQTVAQTVVRIVPDQYPTVSGALAAAQPGDVVRVRAGVYREEIRRTLRGVSIEGEAGATVSAFELLTGWQAAGDGVFFAAWAYNIPPAGNPWPSDVNLPDAAAVRVSVWVGGVRYDPAPSRTSMKPGTFFQDGAAGRLYVYPNGVNLAAVTVEASARQYGLLCSGCEDVVIRGLTFEGCASAINDGCIRVQSSSGMWLEDVTVSRGSYGGVQVTQSANVVIRNLWTVDNGARGFGSFRATGLDALGLVIERSGWRMKLADGVSKPLIAWDGGNKIVRCDGCTFRQVRVSDTHGPGWWLDFANVGTLLEDFEISRSVLAGLFVEAHCETGLTIRRGVIRETSVRNSNQDYFNADLFQTGSNGVRYEDVTVISSTLNAVLLTNPVRSVDGCSTTQRGNLLQNVKVWRLTPGNAFNFGSDTTGYTATTLIQAEVQGGATYRRNGQALSRAGFAGLLAAGSSIVEVAQGGTPSPQPTLTPPGGVQISPPPVATAAATVTPTATMMPSVTITPTLTSTLSATATEIPVTVTGQPVDPTTPATPDEWRPVLRVRIEIIIEEAE